MNESRHIDATTVPPPPGTPVLAPGHTFQTITDKISSIVLTDRVSLGWAFLLLVSLGVAGMLAVAASYLLYEGVGIWGINIPIGWGFAIVNFVWWIGIGHAGTLISAILLLLKQSWRNSINRFAEAMTLFAVMCAGMFPVLHTGRPWLAYWLFPYPNTMQVWPQFRSPLVWDVFAVSTYFTISLVFWYTGLVPDLATLRDSAKNKVARVIYGALSLGWRGSARHWSRYEKAYLLLAGLSTPLVLSVHTVVSFDFAVGIVPGWHTTIFPPYFVAGAIYSGFAMVLVLAIPIRSAYNLKDFITERHLNNCAKFMLATGLIVSYGYIMEGFINWYGGNPYEWNNIMNRVTGTYAPFYFGLVSINIFFVNILWWPKIRKSPIGLFFVSVIILIAMWLERFIIVVVSLQKDFVVSSWGEYIPTKWDYMTFIGTLGFFFAAFLLFIRVLPMISIFEMRDLLPASKPRHEAEVHS
jgi:molybdopterin-containing oxidoreductase family membrane subunit